VSDGTADAEAVQGTVASALYTGRVRHRRFLPVGNTFSYRIYLMYLDLDELPHLFDNDRWWSYERFNAACFQRRYYFGDASVPLKQAVCTTAAARLGRAFAGPVRMLTHLRYLGYCYNPVTFYYLFEADGETLSAIVAEITNTPWGERHAYFLDCRSSEVGAPGGNRWQFPKAFHVSPFMPMDVQYDWRFGRPGERLTVHMQSIITGEKYFDASLDLARRPLSARALNRVLLHYPLMTTKVIAMIHWQALRLWAKRVPFFQHPKYKQEETDENRRGDTRGVQHP